MALPFYATKQFPSSQTSSRFGSGASAQIAAAVSAAVILCDRCKRGCGLESLPAQSFQILGRSRRPPAAQAQISRLRAVRT
jgi:hypothetical protein